MKIPNDDEDYDLPMLHPKLIDWENTENLELDIFFNDHALAIYLNTIEPITPNICSTSESSNASYSQEGVKLSSRKIEIKQGKRPSAENHFMSTLYQSRKKIKDIFDSESLLEVLKYGRFGTLLAFFRRDLPY